MSSIPDPIFKKDMPHISWTKIYERENEVQHSELLGDATYHVSKITKL